MLAKRSDRSVDSRLKRKTAEWFYKLHNKISTPHIEENVGDFRLMSREVVDNIKQMPERNLFMKGILSRVGGKTEIVLYARATRCAGKSKFNGWKLWNLALEGITSFPPSRCGSGPTLVSRLPCFLFTYGAGMVIDTLLWGNPVRGYSSLIVSILFPGRRSAYWHWRTG